jgi:hypothetical protein
MDKVTTDPERQSDKEKISYDSLEYSMININISFSPILITENELYSRHFLSILIAGAGDEHAAY